MKLIRKVIPGILIVFVVILFGTKYHVFGATSSIDIELFTTNFISRFNGWAIGTTNTRYTGLPKNKSSSNKPRNDGMPALKSLQNSTSTDKPIPTSKPGHTPHGEKIFSDNFEGKFSGWMTVSPVTWYKGSPSSGAHSIQLQKNGAIQKTISTIGYSEINISFEMGADSLDNLDESMQALWYDGSKWAVLAQINDGAEDNLLHEYQFSFPKSAENNPDFAIRFQLNGNSTDDYGYIDDVIIRGEKGQSRPTPTVTTTSTPTPKTTNTPTFRQTATPSAPIAPTSRPTPTVTIMPTSTPAPTKTPTFRPRPTITLRPTVTPTPTSRPTPSATATPTSQPTPTVTIMPISTPAPTKTPTSRPTPTITLRPTVTPTPISRPTPSVTIAPTSRPTPTVTIMPTSTPAPTKTPTFRPTPTITLRPTVTPTPTSRPTITLRPTVTLTPTSRPTPSATLNSYTLTMVKTEHGSTNWSGSIEVKEGESIGISAIPDSGYHFVNWTQTGGTGTVVFKNADSESTMAKLTGGPAVIRPNFEINQLGLTITSDGNGRTSPSEDLLVIDGARIKISATANPGYQFINWTQTGGNGRVVFGNANAESTTVTITGGNAIIRANFDIKHYALTVTIDGNGKTSPFGDLSVKDGASIKISATANPGYQFINWTQTGGNGRVIFKDADAENTTVMITGGNAIIQANFQIKHWVLTVTSDGNGRTSPSGDLSVKDGPSIKISATPNPGYQFVNWTQTGGSGRVVLGNANVESTTVTITGGNAIIQANFEIKQCALTIISDWNGRTSPFGDLSVKDGVSIKISAIANYGYQFLNWAQTGGNGRVDFGNVNAENTTVTVTGGNAIIRANFVITQYTLTVTSDQNGRTNPSGNVTVTNEASRTITATANIGYRFVNWAQTGGSGTVVFENDNAENTTVTVTGGNAIIRANFIINQNTLTVTSDQNGRTSPFGEVSMADGASISITATADPGYQFVNWTVLPGTGIVAFGNARSRDTEIKVTGGDAIIKANFSRSLQQIIEVACGGSFGLAIKDDGTVWAWGKNDNGQLGNGTMIDSGFAIPVKYLDKVIAIAAGEKHSLALKDDGTVWAWGTNENGQLGNGTRTYSNIPVQVNGLAHVIAIAAGEFHNLALKNDGTVWAWGSNAHGQLGNGTTASAIVPVQVSRLTNVVGIAGGGAHSLAIKIDGTAWAWGDNNDGQLGNGTTINSSTPVQVNNLTNITTIEAGGNHSLALRSDGTLWAWGQNKYGQLGIGDTKDSRNPVQVNGLTQVIAIAGGFSYSLAVKKDGTVWAWGDFEDGGPGITTSGSVPFQVNYVTHIYNIAAGKACSLVLKDDNTVWMSENNQYGALVNENASSYRYFPVQIAF